MKGGVYGIKMLEGRYINGMIDVLVPALRQRERGIFLFKQQLFL